MVFGLDSSGLDWTLNHLRLHLIGSNMPAIVFHEVDKKRWSDFEQLFDSRGGPKSCWCMVWRAEGEKTKKTKGFDRKRAMEARINDGVPVGLLGYLDGAPVAWCSIAPRNTYRRLRGLSVPDETEENVWALACFFVKRELRGQAIMAQMIQAAIAHARTRDARVVEAYPVDPDSPSYRFMGYVPAFEAAGFHLVGVAGSRRHVMRLILNRSVT
jgi:GNAT superfamily N-acetyltransferase